ncbi:hypothetical protein HUK80_05865 [Flavobacterium sp. MAH-1]|uniref:Alpha-ketoglutarate decarboxylase n=1 Tax=Flavobacterium agri TaxID=2743471 RepID=A0A7Y8Y0P5_9FLAO|nr:hypothetical protein [Flavobacterium agri]NUY80414.1 hypothetical protein [Flavobacterium agri]NYA70439.1 hypothetical protein [Flavobacterium agri]
MKIPAAVRFRLLSILTVWAVFSSASHAQDGSWDGPDPYRSEFWSHVQVGSGLGLGFGSGYTDIAIAPSAIYNFNKYIAAGVGLNGNYVRYKDYSLTIDEYRSWIYGGSVIGLFMPIEQLQLSVELEQLRVNSRLETTEFGTVHDDFWNTGLFVGAGYRTQNVTVGLRYNLLYDPDKTVYADSWMPFVRIYF